MKVSKLIALSSVLLMAACQTDTSPDTSSGVVADAKKSITQPAEWTAETLKQKDLSLNWLAGFNDPKMLELIAEGKLNNLDLQLAAASMEKSWLLAEQSGVTLKPTGDLSLGGSEAGAGTSPSSTNLNVGLTVSWELDVWGRLQSGVNAATANAQAAEADYVFALHSLSANIAKTYLKVIEARNQATITQKNLSILQETMRITQVKYENGLATGQDVALNRANLAAAQEQLTQLQGSQRDAIRALQTLLGRYPDADLEVADALPDLPAQPPAGVPSQILERRPDIISAERKIASAFNATEQAKAARLPRVSLTSSISGASSSLSSLVNPSNLAWQLGTSLVAPLFDGGRRKIDIELATVDQKQAVTNYAKIALGAFSEVETNLDHGLVLANRIKLLTEVLEQSGEAYRIASIRYQEGEIDLLDTLTIQKQAIAAESNLMSVKRLELEQRINLYLALGGAW